MEQPPPKPPQEGITKRELIQSVFDNEHGHAFLLMMMDEAGITRYNPLTDDTHDCWIRRDERQRTVHSILRHLARDPEQIRQAVLQRYQDKLDKQNERRRSAE